MPASVNQTRVDTYIMFGNESIVDKLRDEQTVYAAPVNIVNDVDKDKGAQLICDLVLADGYSLDYKRALLLKIKMNFGYDKLTELFVRKSTCIVSGSQSRLASLQSDLFAIGIETQLTIPR